MGKFFRNQAQEYVNPLNRMPTSWQEDREHSLPPQPVPQLSAHPNFILPSPGNDEHIIQYTLRCAAALVSPPKIEGEDEETACEVVAEALMALYPFILKKWREQRESGGEHAILP